MDFEILGEIYNIETIARSWSIRDIQRLRKFYGGKRWIKRKGLAHIRLADGSVHKAELHWYEAHGIGRIETKIKDILD